MKKQLTKKQEIVLNTLKSFISRKGESPTFRELTDLLKKRGMNLLSMNSLVQYLKVLENKGYIQRFSKTRGTRLLEGGVKNFIEIPLLGRANCGEALCFAENCIEDYINVSKKLILGNQDDYFFIKAIGDSMEKEGIHDSDYILVKKIEVPEDGNIVVAAINGLGTIKKFKKEGDTLALLPSSNNPIHQPIILHQSDQVSICGKVERVFKFTKK